MYLSNMMCDIAFIQQFYKHHFLANNNKRQQIDDLFVYLIIYLAPPTQIVQHLDFDSTVAKQHINVSLHTTVACYFV